VFPDLALYRIDQVLAPYYGWSDDETTRYRQLSVTRWQEWLYENTTEVAFLRRRIALESLYDLADLDPAAVLASGETPVLLLQGADDRWLPADAAIGLANRATAAGRAVTAQVFEGLGHDLGRGSDPSFLLAPQVDEAVFVWLDATLKR